MTGVDVICGTSTFGNPGKFQARKDIKIVYEVLQQHGINILDTAQLYGNSERTLGETEALKSGFLIDTKWLGGWTGQAWASKGNIIDTAKESFEKIGGQKIRVFYMHSPDQHTPLEETLEGVNEAYEQGFFEHFGLSNYSADQVQDAYDICMAKGFLLPSVYQGNYSPVARKAENLVLPKLRELGIAFYAYSPLAGGFLTKTKKQIAEGAGRFGKEVGGGRYLKLYGKPAYLEVLEEWNHIAQAAGCSAAALAYRWVKFNSALDGRYGDAMLVGASSVQQLQDTLDGLNSGPLPATITTRVESIWEKVKHEAPLDNFNF